MSCTTYATQPAVSIGCTTCPTCCQVSLQKRVPERIPVCLDWAHRLDCGGIWTLRSVAHTVKNKDGTSLLIPAHNAANAYALGAQVNVGGAIYTANVAILAGGPSPLDVGQTVWTAAGTTATDLYIPFNTDSKPQEWIDAKAVRTTALVQGGVHDTEYRVEAVATFRDCEGRTIELWDCALVKSENCN